MTSCVGRKSRETIRSCVAYFLFFVVYCKRIFFTAVGWIIAMTAILAVPIVAFAQIGMNLYKARNNPEFNVCTEGLRVTKELSQHTPEWRANAYKSLNVQNQNGNISNEKGHDNKGATIEN